MRFWVRYTGWHDGLPRERRFWTDYHAAQYYHAIRGYVRNVQMGHDT